MAAPQDADAQVTFFSRSGQDSHFAAGVHGYGKQPDSAARQDTDFVHPRRAGASGSRGPVWREASYYEYRPAKAVRHGDHYDVVPGGYHYHRFGYWD